MEKGSFDEEPVEEIVEIAPKRNYWRFVFVFSGLSLFLFGYCLGGNCSTEKDNFLGRVLSGTVGISSRAFSNIFGGGDNKEILRETIILSEARKSSDSPREENQNKSVSGEKAGDADSSVNLPQGGEPTSPVNKTRECTFNGTTIKIAYNVLLNEVAWMGSKGNPRGEWIELRNTSGNAANISGWQLLDSDEQIKIIIPQGTFIEAGGYFLMERGEDALPKIRADYVYTGNIENESDGLRLFDRECSLVDEIIADPVWPAGSASPKYLTAERGSDLSWHSYAGSENDGIFGTPKATNSEVEPAVSKASGGGGDSSALPPPPAPTPPTLSPSSPLTPLTVSSEPLVSEIMVGVDGNADYEFIELYNLGSTAIDLTGWSIKKVSSTGNETTLVAASRLEGKVIPAEKYFLLAREGGYTGGIVPDVRWPTSSSYALAYTDNSIVIYRADGSVLEQISWLEIPKDQSFERESWASGQFRLQITPTPQNSQN